MSDRAKNAAIVVLLGCLVAVGLLTQLERDKHRMLQERYDLEVSSLREMVDTQEQLVDVLRQQIATKDERIASLECSESSD